MIKRSIYAFVKWIFVWILTCRQVGDKPSSKPVLVYQMLRIASKLLNRIPFKHWMFSFTKFCWKVLQGCQRSGKSQGKKYFSRSGKSQGILLKVRENLWIWESQGKVREFCDECLQYIFITVLHFYVPYFSASYGPNWKNLCIFYTMWYFPPLRFSWSLFWSVCHSGQSFFWICVFDNFDCQKCPKPFFDEPVKTIDFTGYYQQVSKTTQPWKKVCVQDTVHSLIEVETRSLVFCFTDKFSFALPWSKISYSGILEKKIINVCFIV